MDTSVAAAAALRIPNGRLVLQEDADSRRCDVFMCQRTLTRRIADTSPPGRCPTVLTNAAQKGEPPLPPHPVKVGSSHVHALLTPRLIAELS